MVDLMMEYLNKVRNIDKETEENLSLLADACQATLQLLTFVCDSNPIASTYIFQWRNFFTTSIVKVDN